MSSRQVGVTSLVTVSKTNKPHNFRLHIKNSQGRVSLNAGFTGNSALYLQICSVASAILLTDVERSTLISLISHRVS